MNGFAKLAMVGVMFCGFGAAALHAEDEAPARRPERRPQRMQERGERGGRGGHHNYSMLVCPNCHRHLLVLTAPGPEGRGGREGRENREGRGGERPPRGRRPGRGGQGRPARTQQPAEN